MKKVVFYETLSGSCPVEAFLDSLSSKQAQKAVWVFSLITKNAPQRNQNCGKQEERIFKQGEMMGDLQTYISKRKAIDPEFAKNFETGYQEFKIGVMLKMAREEAGLTQEQLAEKLKTKKTAISRIENHAEDIKLSTLEKFAKALGKTLEIKVA
jgi:ribosome-binding protein aMBF1 (putative translation factor)